MTPPALRAVRGIVAYERGGIDERAYRDDARPLRLHAMAFEPAANVADLQPALLAEDVRRSSPVATAWRSQRSEIPRAREAR
jgi:hypothetical protein